MSRRKRLPHMIVTLAVHELLSDVKRRARALCRGEGCLSDDKLSVWPLTETSPVLAPVFFCPARFFWRALTPI